MGCGGRSADSHIGTKRRDSCCPQKAKSSDRLSERAWKANYIKRGKGEEAGEARRGHGCAVPLHLVSEARMRQAGVAGGGAGVSG